MGGRKENRPVVFLDVDGVLHSLHGQDFFVEECMQVLKRIMHGSGAYIVLSSTWRTRADQVVLLNRQLSHYGIDAVADQTKDFASGQQRFHRAREEEICEWLDRHPQVQHWVVLDDLDLVSADSKESARLRSHFVKTESEVGLRHEHVAKAFECLDINPAELIARENAGYLKESQQFRPYVQNLKDVRPGFGGDVRGLGPLRAGVRVTDRAVAPRMIPSGPSSSSGRVRGVDGVQNAVSPAIPVGIRAGGSRGAYRTG
jgi:hypothetical protein